MNVFSGQNFALTKQRGPVHCHGESTNLSSAFIPDVLGGPATSYTATPLSSNAH